MCLQLLSQLTDCTVYTQVLHFHTQARRELLCFEATPDPPVVSVSSSTNTQIDLAWTPGWAVVEWWSSSLELAIQLLQLVVFAALSTPW